MKLADDKIKHLIAGFLLALAGAFIGELLSGTSAFSFLPFDVTATVGAISAVLIGGIGREVMNYFGFIVAKTGFDPMDVLATVVGGLPIIIALFFFN